MNRTYLDASALVKLVLPEAESSDLVAYLSEAGTSATTSVVALVEVVRAARRVHAGDEAVLRATRMMEACELDDILRQPAARMNPPELRRLDAIHLASALRVRSMIDTFVTYDRQLADAAQAAGLAVVSPGRS